MIYTNGCNWWGMLAFLIALLKTLEFYLLKDGTLRAPASILPPIPHEILTRDFLRGVITSKVGLPCRI